MTALGRVRAALEGAGSTNPDGGRTWRCPAHDDHNPSLSVTAANGKVLLKCHAGCTIEAVLGKLGLVVAQLFDDYREPRGSGCAKAAAPWRVVSTHDYTDEVGELLYQVHRLEPKGFRQRRPDGSAGWTYNLGDVRRVPYRLQELLLALDAGDPVWIVEGERDADAMHEAGEVATCNSGGAGKWRPEFGAFFTDAEVSIVADKDEPGRKHARGVAASLSGFAKAVRIVEARQGKDAADHLGAGHSVEDFIETHNHPSTARDEDSAVRAENHTELGNARRLIRLHGADLRYSQAMHRWFVWDGRRFAVDDAGEVYRRAKQTVSAIYMEASAAPSLEERKKLADHAKRSESEHSIEAMIALARTEPGISITVEELDADLWLFNVGNGTLDLRTGHLREPRRADLLSRLSSVEYDEHAQAPQWEATLERILPDPDTRTFFQRAVGYAMTGSTSEQKLFIGYGSGANGKSTVLETLRDTFGDYAVHTPGDTLLARRETGIPNDVARLRGSRFITVIETEDGQRLAESRVKSLTGGDMVAARFMRGEWFEFRLVGKIWLATNHRPAVRGTDLAIWRRIRLIPFTVTIPEAEWDRDLRGKLHDELPGILAWAVRGCLEWQRHGLGDPEQVVNATAEYRADEDMLGRFLEERCGLGDGLRVGATELYDAFKLWADAANESELTQKRFGTQLRERGFDTTKDSATRRAVWLGIDLLSQAAME